MFLIYLKELVQKNHCTTLVNVDVSDSLKELVQKNHLNRNQNHYTPAVLENSSKDHFVSESVYYTFFNRDVSD